MATISGKDGKVVAGGVELADIVQWSLTTRSHNPAYASSSTGGFKKRIAGVKDGSGAVAFKLDPDDAITDQISEGDAVTLLLYVDATRYYSVPALIDTLRLEVDIDSGDIVGGVAEFSTNGAWTKPS